MMRIRQVSMTAVALATLLLALFSADVQCEASAPIAHFDAQTATAAYLATMPAAAQARSDAYFEGGYWLLWWDFCVALLVSWLLLRSQLSARFRDLAQRMTRFRWLQSALYGAMYLLIVTVVTLPWNAFEGYYREHQYGMSNQTLGAWLSDSFKSFLLTIVFGSIGLAIVYAVIRRTLKSWWLWGSLVTIVFIVLTAMVSPAYLEPIFNKFYPLADGTLKQQILSIARANAIPVNQVYEFDASKQTKRISAHVSGLFGTVRISLNDNLINRASQEEVLAVMGHEMGHYVLNHSVKNLIEQSLLIVVGFAFAFWSFGAVLSRFGAGWGVRDVGDTAGLPVLAAILSVYGLLTTPLQNTIVRTDEIEADAFGLNAARQPDGFAQAALHLSEYRKMRPGPVEEFIFFNHPSGRNRIHRAMVWKAENIKAADIVAYDAAHQPPGMTP